MMKTNLIYSNSKYGALKGLLKQLSSNLSSGREQIVIVPDKFSLNAEKLIMEFLNIESTTLINVTSLDRMADTYCKNLNLTYLTKYGGIMLVQKILLENASNLNIFKRTYKFSGFCEDLFNNIMLLKSCNISPENLKDSSKTLDSYSQLKIAEIAQIYSLYENSLSDRFYDSANKLTIFKQQLILNNNYANCDFYYAMFDDFTPQALGVIDTLKKYCHSQNFALQRNNREQSWDFFDDIATRKINTIFCNDAVNIIETNEKYTSTKNAIEQKIGLKNNTDISFTNEISFWQANNIQEELEFVAKNICYLIKTQNLRYNQISLAVADLEKLQPEIKHIFAHYSVPFYIDMPKSLSELVLPKYIFSILNAIVSNFQQKDLLSIVKSSFFNQSSIGVQLFENYLIEYDISGEAIFNSISARHKNFSEINPIHTQLCEIFNIFKQALQKSKTIDDYCELIKRFINSEEIKNYLESICDKIELLNETTLSKQNQQSLDSLNNILDELQHIFGITQTTFEHFLELLEAGCQAMQISSAPTSVDCVFIGDSNNSIFSQNDYFFFINCTENAFPISQNDCGLILDTEIKKLSTEITIEPTIKQTNIKGVFNSYNNLFLYQDKAMFSYSLNSLTMEEQKPSSFLLDVMSIFSSDSNKVTPCSFQKINNYINENSKENILLNNICEYSAIKNIIKFLKQPQFNSLQKQITFNTIYNALKDNKKTSFIDTISLNDYTKNKDSLPLIKTHFETKKHYSVTEVECYYKCPFKHFLDYVLNLNENPKGIMQKFDIGNFLHKIAENFINSLIKEHEKFYDDKKLSTIVNAIIKETIESAEFTKFFKNSENDYLLTGLKKEAERMCGVLNDHNKVSDFTNFQTEYSFTILLNDLGISDVSADFFGKIDRIDKYGSYFRIIDYKTGADEYKISNLYYGKKIQLHLYAFALSKNLKKQCSGVFYMPIKDEYININSQTVSKDYYKLNGVLLEDIELALAQDKSLDAEHLKSRYIPIKFNNPNAKTGELSFNKNSSRVCPKDVFEGQLQYAKLIFFQAISEILAGNIKPSPYKESEKTPCIYCPYNVACGFDENSGGCYRVFETINKNSLDKYFKEIANGK